MTTANCNFMEPSSHAIISEENPNSYVIRPQFEQKFRPWTVKSILSKILRERLENEVYSPENIHEKCVALSDEIKQTLKKTLSLQRYRYLVQVIIGEQRAKV
ncbi:unnamed protein product [Heterobilharzia americana]|nr:unnamed protein product [Heterobilharzia americana]